ncbi:unnamed protein product [Leptidea sinapis]|uniref:Uncharacterized protein n=1 Tax=Leptidea sinapis TaxID=189913 RepID=A0A5E4QU31_9NEOP|nr:unnamed protein product [Leptidea sinapis]
MINILMKNKMCARWRSSCNWPELKLYCGCLELKTGIIIYSIINLILIIVLSIANALALGYLINVKTLVKGLTPDDVSNHFNVTFTDDDLRSVQSLFKVFIIYIVLWMVLKAIYSLALIWIMYSLIFKKPKLLKLMLYVIIVNWSFDIIVLIGGVIVLKTEYQIASLIITLTEGYNLIAINSQYKRFTFKSRIVPEEHLNSSATHTNIQALTTNNVLRITQYEQPHCQTCSCLLSPTTETSDITLPVTESPVTTNSITDFENPTNAKTMNLKDMPIIFNQEQLQVTGSPLYVANGSDDGDVFRPERPTTLELRSNINRDMNSCVNYDETMTRHNE